MTVLGCESRSVSCFSESRFPCLYEEELGHLEYWGAVEFSFPLEVSVVVYPPAIGLCKGLPLMS